MAEIEIDAYIEMFRQKIDSLSKSLLDRWKLEAEITNAGPVKAISLKKERDEMEEKYNAIIQEIEKLLEEPSNTQPEHIIEIVKRIGTFAYKEASVKHAGGN